MIPKRVRVLFEKEIGENLQKMTGEEEKGSIGWKVEHSYRVVEMGKRIAGKENGVRLEMNRVETVCLLHDIGRFRQVLHGSFSDDETKVNHAKLGAKIVEEAGFDEEVAEAVREHNNPVYGGDNIYAKLVRDADQLTIISELERQMASFSEECTLGKEVADKFRAGEIIDSKNVCGLKEWLLEVYSWQRHFFFGASGKIFVEDGWRERLEAEIKKRGMGYLL